MPSITQLFWVSFAVTLIALIVTFATGWRGIRRVHLVLAPITVLLLAATIWLAERLGRARVFPPGPMQVHLAFAKSAALLVLPVLVTGVVLWRRGRWRLAHRVSVILFLAVTLVATGTGVWVFGLSTPP